MLAASIAVLLSLNSGHGVQKEVFSSDARLTTPITLRLKCVSLASMADALQSQTKVHFNIAPDIAQRKVTVIFHDRSPREFMAALETAMMMQWKKNGNGYVLTLPLRVERDEQDQLDVEKDAYRTGLADGISACRAAASLSDSERQAKIADIRAKIKALKESPAPDASAQLAVLQEDVSVLQSRPAQAIFNALADSPTKIADGLVGGTVYCASTRPQDGTTKLPAGALDSLFARMPDATGALVVMRFSPEQEGIDGRTICVPSDIQRGTSVTGFFFYTPLLHHPLSSKASGLLSRLQKWDAAKDPTVMAKAVSMDGPKESDPGYFSRFGSSLTLAEHLEYLADHADIPVIGDAFRAYCSGAGFTSASTVDGYLKALSQMRPERAGRDVQPIVNHFASQNGWLMARHNGYWRRYSSEIPEEALAPLEHAAATKDVASMDDYASLAIKLTKDQARAITNTAYRLALRFDPMPLQRSLGSLQLWATLNEAQRKQSLVFMGQASETPDQGFNLANLDPAQVQIVLSDWADKMWRGEISPRVWPVFFSPKGLVEAKTIFKVREFGAPPPGLRADAALPQRPAQRPRQPMQSGTGGSVTLIADFEYHLLDNIQITDMFAVGSTHPKGQK